MPPLREEPTVIEATSPPEDPSRRAALIFLHGLGDDAHGWESASLPPAFPNISLPTMLVHSLDLSALRLVLITDHTITAYVRYAMKTTEPPSDLLMITAASAGSRS